MGYGLYEIGVESMDELKGLSDSLSEELRATTLAGICESTEEVSTTWKLLQTANNVSSFFSEWTSGGYPKESGSVTKLDNKKDNVDTLFEKRQREQIQSAAKNLRLNVEKVVNVEFEKLPYDLRCRLERIFSVLLKADLVKNRNKDATKTNEQLSLSRLMELCAKIEKNGNLATNVRHEFSTLVHPIIADLEAQARRLRLEGSTGSPGSLTSRPRTESDKENAENQVTTQDGSPRKATQSQQPLRVPLLAPPPRSANGIANAQLIF
jgi:hypothetical protein